MAAKPSCFCGTCECCKSRAYAAKSRAKRKGWQGGRDWIREPAPKRELAQPVVWHPDLTALRRAAGDGAVVSIGQAGVTVVLIGKRLHFDSLDAALDWATRPAPFHHADRLTPVPP
jgi:hypothetical protein